MPIEFRCGQCGKLLRTGDETAGKQAKCPSCGTVQPIPLAAGGGPFASPPSQGVFGEMPSPPPSQGVFGELPSLPPVGSDNPYASPLSTGPALEYRTGFAGPRTGPPWEQNGPSFGSFVDTVKLMYSSLGLFFSSMRCEGGLGRPLGFAVIGGSIGGLVAVLFSIGIQALFMMVGAQNGAGLAPGAGLGFLGIMTVVVIVLMPIGIVLQTFITSAVFHVCLMMLGGANRAFETTFRVVAYSSGSTAMLLLIPFCGQYVQGIVNLIFSAIGLMHAHETTGVKATFAVLLPIFLCCGGAIVFYALIIGAVVMNAR